MMRYFGKTIGTAVTLAVFVLWYHKWLFAHYEAIDLIFAVPVFVLIGFLAVDVVRREWSRGRGTLKD